MVIFHGYGSLGPVVPSPMSKSEVRAAIDHYAASIAVSANSSAVPEAWPSRCQCSSYSRRLPALV